MQPKHLNSLTPHTPRKRLATRPSFHVEGVMAQVRHRCACATPGPAGKHQHVVVAARTRCAWRGMAWAAMLRAPLLGVMRIAGLTLVSRHEPDHLSPVRRTSASPLLSPHLRMRRRLPWPSPRIGWPVARPRVSPRPLLPPSVRGRIQTPWFASACHGVSHTCCVPIVLSRFLVRFSRGSCPAIVRVCSPQPLGPCVPGWA